MKSRRTWSILGVAALVGILLFVYGGNTTNEKEMEPVTSIFILTTLEQNVSIKDTDDGVFTTVQKELYAHEGAIVRTSETGRALIEAEGRTSTVIDRNSEVTIDQLSDNGGNTRLSLHFGRLWSRVEKIFEKGEFYEIKTQNTVAAVRGTSFGIYFKDGITEILVSEGVVDVLTIDPITKKEVQSTVPSGRKAVVETGKDVVIKELTLEDRNSEWYLLNTDKVDEEQTFEGTLKQIEEISTPTLENSLQKQPTQTTNRAENTNSLQGQPESALDGVGNTAPEANPDETAGNIVPKTNNALQEQPASVINAIDNTSLITEEEPPLLETVEVNPDVTIQNETITPNFLQ